MASGRSLPSDVPPFVRWTIQFMLNMKCGHGTWLRSILNASFRLPPGREPCPPPGISSCTNRVSVMWKPKSKPKRGGEHKDTKFHCLVEKEWKGRCGFEEVEWAAILSWGRNRCILTIHICKGSMPVSLESTHRVHVSLFLAQPWRLADREVFFFNQW